MGQGASMAMPYGFRIGDSGGAVRDASGGFGWPTREPGMSSGDVLALPAFNQGQESHRRHHRPDGARRPA
jgi:hypothetical protein